MGDELATGPGSAQETSSVVSRSSAGTRPAESALRLSNEQAAEIEAIVRVENVPRAEKGTRALGATVSPRSNREVGVRGSGAYLERAMGIEPT